MKIRDIKKILPDVKLPDIGKTPEEIKKLKNRALAGTVAAATVLSMFVSTTVQNPADLIDDEDIFTPPAPIVEMVSDIPDEPDNGDEDEGITDEEKKRGGIKERIRSFLLSRSPIVRVCICLPMWAIGWGLTALFSALCSMLSPVGGTILSLVLAAAVILAVLVGVVKTVSPDKPLREILTKKNICLSAVAAATAELLLTLAMFIPGGEKYVRLIRALLMLTAVLAVTVPLTVKEYKKEKQKETAAA